MKIIILVFTLFSVGLFSQQKKDLLVVSKDSLAMKNVNTILDYSKKSFSNFSDSKSSSEVSRNLDQLLINNINFNTVINNRAVNTVDVGSFANPRVDAMDMLGRQVLNLQIYKSK